VATLSPKENLELNSETLIILSKYGKFIIFRNNLNGFWDFFIKKTLVLMWVVLWFTQGYKCTLK